MISRTAAMIDRYDSVASIELIGKWPCEMIGNINKKNSRAPPSVGFRSWVWRQTARLTADRRMMRASRRAGEERERDEESKLRRRVPRWFCDGVRDS